MRTLCIGFSGIVLILIGIIAMLGTQTVENATTPGTCLPIEKGGTGCDADSTRNSLEVYSKSEIDTVLSAYRPTEITFQATELLVGYLTSSGNNFHVVLPRWIDYEHATIDSFEGSITFDWRGNGGTVRVDNATIAGVYEPEQSGIHIAFTKTGTGLPNNSSGTMTVVSSTAKIKLKYN